jgi:cob(I)alamin adenosyltransferase
LINDLNATLPPLKDFVLPGSTRAAAHCHQARAICRRAERQLCKLAEEKEINRESLKYINRLSDALFVVARTLARQENQEETIWDHERI